MTGIYSPQNAKLTLQNLVTIKSEFEHKENIKIELLVKPKRRYLNNHSAEYLNMLKNYSDNHEVTLLSPQSNLYEIIQGSSLILCYPFTSPALIAKELGIPVKFIFYSKDWVNLPEQMQGIALITNEADLLETLKLTLVK
jgi:polysaccharide biosynthesis PFTS motif protein